MYRQLLIQIRSSYLRHAAAGLTTLALALGFLLAPVQYTANAQSMFGMSSSLSSRAVSTALSADSDTPARSAEIDVRTSYACPTPASVTGSQANWTVNNTSNIYLTMYVADADNNAYQVLERVGSPAVRTWTPKLANGTYHLVCVFRNTEAKSSHNFTVTGSTITNAPKFKVLTESDIAPITLEHAAWQKKQLLGWLEGIDTLAHAVASGDRAAAQSAWLASFKTYRSFDDSSQNWPGPASDLAAYYDVEKVLWSSAPVSQAPADKLAAAAHGVVDALNSSYFALSSPDYGLRTHEVMEEFERFDMRGERDFGSHSLPTALRADVASTRAMLNPLVPLVQARGVDTKTIDAQLNAVDNLAEEFDKAYGGQLAFADWPLADRERLEGAIARLNELLAPIATMTVIRRI